MSDDVGAAPDHWDIRMGYGLHECLGREIGDELMVRIIARPLTLGDLAIETQLKKRWGWIVEEFAVRGPASLLERLRSLWRGTDDDT
jgi:hypothetical protein